MIRHALLGSLVGAPIGWVGGDILVGVVVGAMISLVVHAVQRRRRKHLARQVGSPITL